MHGKWKEFDWYKEILWQKEQNYRKSGAIGLLKSDEGFGRIGVKGKCVENKNEIMFYSDIKM